MKYNVGDSVMYKGEVCKITDIDVAILPVGEPFIYTLDNDQSKLALTKDLSPATPPANDKEYREWVEDVMSGIESDLKQKQNDLKLCESGELIMDNELREEMYQDVEYMPRLIADIKKGAGQSVYTVHYNGAPPDITIPPGYEIIEQTGNGIIVQPLPAPPPTDTPTSETDHHKINA